MNITVESVEKLEDGFRVVLDMGHDFQEIDIQWDDLEEAYNNNPYGGYDFDGWLENCMSHELEELCKEAAIEKQAYLSQGTTKQMFDMLNGLHK